MLKFRQFIAEAVQHFNADEADHEDTVQNKMRHDQKRHDYVTRRPGQALPGESLNESTALPNGVQLHPTNPKRTIVQHTADARTSAASSVEIPTAIIRGANVSGGKGKPNILYPGVPDSNAKRREVYGDEHHKPLTVGQVRLKHEAVSEEHFEKSESEQHEAELKAMARLHAAGHLRGYDPSKPTPHPDDKEGRKGKGKRAFKELQTPTLQPGEKTDTAHYETDEHGQQHSVQSSKMIAGHSSYSTGSAEDEKQSVISTCPHQTKGCGGGVSESGEANPKAGSCFAPKSEQQYGAAAINRHLATQAMHDPRMTSDWALAHIHSLKNHAANAIGEGKRPMYRPNVVSENQDGDHAHIANINKQIREKDPKNGHKKTIISNSYGKGEKEQDVHNGIHVTYSNGGAKTKDGLNVSDNQTRDARRIRQTITSQTASGKKITNKDGQEQPAKGSYAVHDIPRGSPDDKRFQDHITHAKYWDAGTKEQLLSDEDAKKPDEGHYDADGKATTPENAHHGHKTVTREDGERVRYTYQKQHVQHPRLVQTPKGPMPTDSRHHDEKFLPDRASKERYKGPKGAVPGGIMATSATKSTKGDELKGSFLHPVQKHIEKILDHAKKNNGEWEIDKPEDQEAARGKGEYEEPTKKPVVPQTKKKASGKPKRNLIDTINKDTRKGK